jgi:hypothetical protein
LPDFSGATTFAPYHVGGVGPADEVAVEVSVVAVAILAFSVDSPDIADAATFALPGGSTECS